MTIELTDAERLAASNALSRVPPAANFYTVGVESVFIAGIRAGLERAAKLIDDLPHSYDGMVMMTREIEARIIREAAE